MLIFENRYLTSLRVLADDKKLTEYLMTQFKRFGLVWPKSERNLATKELLHDRTRPTIRQIARVSGLSIKETTGMKSEEIVDWLIKHEVRLPLPPPTLEDE